MPTARPGHRAPHCWLADGRSILDAFGKYFTLLCFDGAGADAMAMKAKAETMRVPLDVVVIDEPIPRQIYGAASYVLVRPDLMVAFRG